MLIALEIRTVVYLTLFRAAYIFYFRLDNKNRLVLPRCAQSQWFKSSCNASVFQSTSYQKKNIFNKDRNALWNWGNLNLFSIQTQVPAHSVNKSFSLFPVYFWVFNSSFCWNTPKQRKSNNKKKSIQQQAALLMCLIFFLVVAFHISLQMLFVR